MVAAARVEVGLPRRKAVGVATAAAARTGALCNGGPASAAGGAGGRGAFMGIERSGERSHGVTQICGAKDCDCDLYVGVEERSASC